MPQIRADDGVRLHYAHAGDPTGRPVVLLAGFKAPATSWRYQVPALAAAGYRVLTVDLRGHGEGERPATGVDMARRGRDLRDVMELLDLRDAVLIGGSMGASTVWSYLDAEGAGRVAAIVSVDQTPKMLNTADWPHGFYGYTSANVDTYFAEGIPETGHGTPLLRRGMRLIRLLRAMKDGERELSPGELALLADHATADWRPVIAAAEPAILFVAGSDSEFWPSSHAAAAAALAARGESAVIARDGHAANIEQPKAFNAGVLEFLARTAPARTATS
ncbi:alpha/beta fold hydrolase [Microbacterium kyungheense]|uniref:Pimeloyl-ACP methyl ester carboxylesterase n=1 Tax=Microbacterium kyungheense TaxID=1263636 RepID=A0A543F1E1_9MICO|nr:alpha/beta hydrolase [Microbacterium kyungheense]TQM27642.1 pimeloyl-ACP methyl ester carboxylesterase [Microbacterium kyungheense]